MRRASSVSLPRMGTGSTRLLRLRADAALLDMLRPGAGRDGGILEVPSRELVNRGEPIRVEISFGPMSDEVELFGEVSDVLRDGDNAPQVRIRIASEHAQRVRYVRQVLDGQRSASARSHRRIPTDLPVRWRRAGAQYASRVRDLSRGGAFIATTELPSVGDRIEVEIWLSDRTPPLRFDSVVSWIRPSGSVTGFGVSFKLQDRADAAALTRAVREQESLSP